jgi:predicted amidophosphoribosyltransferase
MLEIEGIDTIQWIGVYRWRGDSNASQLLSRFIREFKVGEKLYIEFLTFLATQFLEESRDLIEKVDVLVPVPADPDRASERGHDLAADIATATSLAFAIPMEQPLMRMSGSPNSRFCSFDELFQQFRLDERFKNGYDGIKVLLVDDIVTRGNTMRVCARFLRSAGALSVCGFSIARSESTNKSANALMS